MVPWNDEIQEIVYRNSLKYLSFQIKGRARAIDFGVGTGHGASLFLSENKDAELIGVDFSEKMIEKARKNLTSNGLIGRAMIINTDFTQWNPPKGIDIAFSAIAIHNATDSGKKALFGRIWKSLKNGGVFINGDFVRSEAGSAQKAWEKYYAAYMKNYLSAKELKAWMHHAFIEDKPAKLSEQQKWMEEAGFSEFGVLWQKNNLAIYFARK